MFAQFDGPAGAALLQAAHGDVELLKRAVQWILDHKVFVWGVTPKMVEQAIKEMEARQQAAA